MNTKHWFRRCGSIHVICAVAVTLEAYLILACETNGSPFLIASDYFGPLRRVDPASGTILGTLSTGSGVDEIDLGPDGLIYGSNFESSIIRKVNPFTGLSAGSISLPGKPRDVTFGPDGLLYIALTGDGFGHGTIGVYRYNLSNQQLSLFNTSVLNGTPIGITFGAANDLWVCLDTRYNGSGSHSVVRIDGQTGNFENVFANQNISIPQSLAFGPDGILYVGNQGTQNITKYSASGTYLGILTSLAQNPQGLYFLPDGNLVFGRGGSNFARIDMPSGSLSVFSNGYGFAGGMVLVVPEPSTIALVVIGAPFVLMAPRSRRQT